MLFQHQDVTSTEKKEGRKPVIELSQKLEAQLI